MFERMRDIWSAAGERYREAAGTRETRAHALRHGDDWRRVEDGDRLALRLKRKGMSDAMAASLVRGANADPAVGRVLLERIIEDSELLDVAFLTIGARLSRGVARVQIRSPSARVLGHGTGFLVSPALLLTNHHVLGDAGEAARSVVQFDFFDRPDGSPARFDEFRLEPDLFFETSRALDFTMVAVAPQSEAGAALAGRPWNPLIRESGKVLVGEPVNIIQHPGGDTMKVACRGNQVVDRLDRYLHYVADTMRGSSGAQVCNDRWELAALHHAGVPQTDANGRILLTDGSLWDRSRASMARIAWVANEGVRISRIVGYLDGLEMTPAARALYDACFEPCRLLLEEGSPGEPIGSGPADDIVRKAEADGSVSWYFRVNFGPAAQGAAGMPVAVPSQPAPVPAPPAPRRRDPAAPPPPDRALSVASDLIDRFRPDRPYLDEAGNQADIAAYYDGIDMVAGPGRLYQVLGELVSRSHTTWLSYRAARLGHLYPWVDLRENGSLRNVYSGSTLDPAEVVAEELERFELARPGFLDGFSPDELADGAEADADEALDLLLEAALPFNCEHVVPQSWFGKRQPMRADLHHLFTCEPACNSFRGNIPYFDFAPLLAAQPAIDREVVRGDCGQRLGDRFEPELGHGVVARATLYFLLRYPGQIGDDERELQRSRLDVLLAWHEAQTPSRYEKHRNAAIFAVQGNRNPLIDFPELGRRISFERGFV